MDAVFFATPAELRAWFERNHDQVHWVVSAKRAETRERRPAQLIADSAAGGTMAPLTRR